jgi:hypothetical protein
MSRPLSDGPTGLPNRSTTSASRVSSQSAQKAGASAAKPSLTGSFEALPDLVRLTANDRSPAVPIVAPASRSRERPTARVPINDVGALGRARGGSQTGGATFTQEGKVIEGG